MNADDGQPGPTVRAERAAEGFRRAFGRSPEGVWEAPGRINLIGEHTDYNDGFALPLALPRTLTIAAARRTDGVWRSRSPRFSETVETDGEAAPGSVDGWGAYPTGCRWVLLDEGHDVGGMDLFVDGSVPMGGGLSTSAALCCAALLAATDLYGIDADPGEVARWARRAENDFVGVPCGAMDQLAVMASREGRALFLDCRSLTTEPIPFAPDEHDLSLLVVDTRAPHRLVEGAYAERRRSCERAARALGVPALRDVDLAGLPRALDRLPDDRARARVRHVVTENARVLETVALLREGRVREIGPSLTASHVSLRDDYEVSVPEVDTAVEAALSAGALGARITGGGFGGCVIALVDTDRVASCVREVRSAFAERGFGEPSSFAAPPSDGARRLR